MKSSNFLRSILFLLEFLYPQIQIMILIGINIIEFQGGALTESLINDNIVTESPKKIIVNPAKKQAAIFLSLI